MTGQLLPCPFCGGDAEVAEIYPEKGTKRSLPFINCPSCGADNSSAGGLLATLGYPGFDTEEAARDHWNKRVRPS